MELFLVGLGVIMGILTSCTDIKTGFIDDKHVFPIAGIGVLYHLYYGIAVKHDVFYAFSGLIGLAIGFLLGYLLYLMGGWASGDVVILMGYSALFPYASSYAKIVPPYAVRYPLHGMTLLFNSVLAVFPFIFFYSLAVLVIRRKTARLKEIFVDKWPKPFELALWISAAFVILRIVGKAIPSQLGVLIWAIAIVILAKLQKVGDVVGLMLFAYGAFKTPEIIYSYLKLAATFYTFKVFFSLVKVLREEVLTKKVSANELKEWDILGEWIYEKDGKIYRDREGSFDKVIRALKTLNPNALRVEYDKLIASPTAEGLRKEDIETLKALVNEGKLEDGFIVRNAMPFAPALFLGFLISVFYGDLFWWLVLKSSGL